jgi:hypothetical protein
LGAIADIDVNEGRLDDATERYAVGLPLMRAASTTRGLVAYLHSMAELALMSQDPGRAVSLADEAQGGAHATRDTWHLALLASVRASAARDLGRPAPEQRDLSLAALRAAVDQPDPHVVLDVVEHVGGGLVDLGRHDEALRLLRATRLVRERTGIACSRPRRARRDADEAAAARGSRSSGPKVDVDLEWLVAASSDAVSREEESGASPDR